MKVAWTTDIHLDWIDQPWKRDELVRSIRADAPDAVVLTGDVADGWETARYLRFLESELRRPIYFVLGNHEFYGRSIRKGRREIAALAAESEHLVYLTTMGVVELTPTTAIIGHDSWGDARLGNYERSKVWLPDFVAVRDLAEVSHDRELLRRRLHALGDEAARHLRSALPEALEEHPRVVLATHVPPYRESAWHDGGFSDDDWLPFFSCKAVGDVLREVIERRPDRELLVLCGHTHGSGEAQILDNLRVLTGGAGYERPWRHHLLELD
ncbi:MAG TPA: metallophosphoesterase [Thermoguttaceae bacterium]|nr:metallophosphoesterase [Thermoguttaceae bacterium]